MSLFLTVAITMVVAFIVLIAIWPREGKWGINLSKTCCPRCGQRMPRWRKPANERQALWGGWTCKQCGCEMDKYGTEIEDDTEPLNTDDG